MKAGRGFGRSTSARLHISSGLTTKDLEGGWRRCLNLGCLHLVIDRDGAGETH
jgi:hypothetical protein